MLYKNIHIGSVIKQKVKESDIHTLRICNFLKCTEADIKAMYEVQSMDTELLLKWCKLLEYDLFRIYSQHLLLYAPQKRQTEVPEKAKSSLPIFRKNIYTKEVIDFIIERIANNHMTRQQVIDEYKIPKTTLHKWLHKYQPK